MQPGLFEAPAQVGCLTPEALGNYPPDPAWRSLLQGFFAAPQGQGLRQFLLGRLEQGAVVYPPTPYQALELTPLAAVRVVILGQDPYHGPGQAHGLAFSVPEGAKPPPSLNNIFKELARGQAAARPSPHLARWARQGVLLLNTCLTVEDGQPASHAKRGWEALTDALLQVVAGQPRPVAFLLWGAHAQAKRGLIDAAGRSAGAGHLILTANHPSPLSALRPPEPFIGCGHFEAANAFLGRHGQPEVRW